MKNTMKTVRFCFSLMWRSSKWAFAAHLLVMTLLSLYAVLNVNLIKNIIDMLTEEDPRLHKIYLFIGLYIFLLIFIEMMHSLKKILWDYTYDKARNEFQKQVYDKLIKMPMVYVDSENGRNDVDDIVWMADSAANMAYDIWECIAALLNFYMVFYALAGFSVIYTFIALALIVPSVIGNLSYNRRMDRLRRSKTPSARKIHYYRWILTAREPARDVRMYNLADDIKGRFEEEKSLYLNEQKKLDWRQVFLSSLTELLKYGGIALFSVYAVIAAYKGRITIGEMSLYIGYITLACSSFSKIAECVCEIRFHLVKQMERVFAYFARPGGLEDNKGTRGLEEFQSLEFDKVYFKYPASDEYVLKGASFIIHKGDKVSLVGINGAGKSTMIKVMLGLYEIEAGCIYINGYRMQEYNIQDIRKLFSVMFQSCPQYSLTLRETIGLSDLGRMNDEGGMKEAMHRSGVMNFSSAFYDGFDTYITKKFTDDGAELSKGQHQRLALCRAYFKDAPIIVFDEPSAALDAEAEDEVFKNFERLSQDKTGIMISHRISGSRLAGKILVLDGGIIAECGTHEELVKKKEGIYANLYALQKNKYKTGGSGAE